MAIYYCERTCLIKTYAPKTTGVVVLSSKLYNPFLGYIVNYAYIYCPFIGLNYPFDSPFDK